MEFLAFEQSFVNPTIECMAGEGQGFLQCPDIFVSCEPGNYVEVCSGNFIFCNPFACTSSLFA